jgi:hypothetical protein
MPAMDLGTKEEGSNEADPHFLDTMRERLAVLKDMSLPQQDTPLTAEQTPLPERDTPLPDSASVGRNAQPSTKKGQGRKNATCAKHKSSQTRSTANTTAAATATTKHWAAAATSGRKGGRRGQSRRN